MKKIILIVLFSLTFGLSNFSSAQEEGKVSAMFEKFDIATWSYEYYSGTAEYEILKGWDGKPYYRLTYYTIFGWRGEPDFASGPIESSQGILMEQEKTINGVKYGFYTIPFIGGPTIYIK